MRRKCSVILSAAKNRCDAGPAICLGAPSFRALCEGVGLHDIFKPIPIRSLTLCLLLAYPATALIAVRTCYSPEEALTHQNKDVCIAAHVYDVVELSDGTRFLDLCSPETSDEDCRFTVMSLNSDRKEVGDLDQYREKNIELRGVVHAYRGRGEILLSHARQFHDGAEKFHPNPALLHGFSAENGKPAINDPAMRSGHHRSVFKTAH